MPLIRLAVAALLLALVASSADAQFTCSTVARDGQFDPDGAVFGSTFRDEVAINSSGAAVFVAKPNGGRDKLYLHPVAAAGQVVARADGPAPNGGAFRSQRAFFFLSVNDGSDVGFLGLLAKGQGVFVRDGGVLETAAVTAQASPAGGTFASFPFVGDIDGGGRVPFIATVDGGPGGVFVYDSTADAVTSLVPDGTPTADGREICSTQAVDLGAASLAVIRAISKVSCLDGGETARAGIFRVTGSGISTVVLDGDASPVGFSSYAKFFGAPRLDAAGDVAFRATTFGATRADGIFVWSATSGTVALAEQTGDAAPVVGGSFGANQSFRFTDSGDVLLNAKLQATPAKAGIFVVGASDVPALVKTDTPPADGFGFGSRYSRFNRTNGASRDGSWIGVQVRVRDTARPPSKGGIVRCHD